MADATRDSYTFLGKIIRFCDVCSLSLRNTALQKQKAVSDHLYSKQILPFAFARQHGPNVVTK